MTDTDAGKFILHDQGDKRLEEIRLRDGAYSKEMNLAGVVGDRRYLLRTVDTLRAEIKDWEDEPNGLDTWRNLWGSLRKAFPDAPQHEHSPEELVDWAKKEIEKLRAEAKEHALTTERQDAIRSLVIKEAGAAGIEIDGGGGESGDPWDFTMDEIRQGFTFPCNYIFDHLPKGTEFPDTTLLGHIKAVFAEVDRLRAEAKALAHLIEETVMRHDGTGEVAYGEYTDDGDYCPPEVLPNIPVLEAEAKAARGKALEDCEREIRSWAIVGKSADHYAKKIRALMSKESENEDG